MRLIVSRRESRRTVTDARRPTRATRAAARRASAPVASPWRFSGWFGRAVAVWALAGTPGHSWAVGTSSVRLETGADYDSNATREEAGGPADAVWRGVAELRGAVPFGRGGRVTGGWHGGGKLHVDATGEDVLHQKADASVQQGLGSAMALRLDAGVRDRTTRAPVQSLDHTRLSAGPGLDVRLGELRLGARGLYDRTIFKDDRDLDADAYGGHALIGYGTGPWSTSLSGTFLRRDFDGIAQVVIGHDPAGLPILADDASRRRRDRHLRAALEGQYGGDFLLSGEAAWERTDSNSVGGGLRRGVLRLQATTTLPAQLVLTAGATLQHIAYDDAQHVSETALIEDEGRQAVSLRLERPLDDTWSVLVHGGLWFSPEASRGQYARTVAGLAVGYGFDR